MHKVVLFAILTALIVIFWYIAKLATKDYVSESLKSVNEELSKKGKLYTDELAVIQEKIVALSDKTYDKKAIDAQLSMLTAQKD